MGLSVLQHAKESLELGEIQAEKYGALFRQLQLPIIYPIMASPFCRAIETAQRAFKDAPVEVDPFWIDINNLGAMPPTEKDRVLYVLKTKLEIAPSPGYNQVIIAHSFPNGVGLGEIPYMGTVIVRPLGQGNGFDIIARFSLDDLAH